MRLSSKLMICVAVALFFGVSGCGGGGGSRPVIQPSPNFIKLQSDAGDYIGQGKSYSYTQADAKITATAAGNLLTVNVQGDQQWIGNFKLPSNIAQLQVGRYDNAQRFPFNAATVPGMDWTGEGRGSNTLTGWFQIKSVSYVGGQLDAIDLDFELHSEGIAPALHGQIHWTAHDTTQPPGPVFPPPSNLWQPAPGATPAGDYVYLESEAGDYIGQGKTYTYTPGSAPVTFDLTGGHLSVRIDGAVEWWSGDFQSMTGSLDRGYYGGLMRFPFNNPVKGGLQWSGMGNGANQLIGWFVVDDITIVNGKLTSIDLRFEQKSDGSAAALHGKIHWHP